MKVGKLWLLPLATALLVGCGGGAIEVTTPLQGQVQVSSEREARRVSRALLDRIDEDQAELDKTEEQLKRSVGPERRAEREELTNRKQELQGDVRRYLGEFLAYVPKVREKGWTLEAFDDARYFYYSYAYRELQPKS